MRTHMRNLASEKLFSTPIMAGLFGALMSMVGLGRLVTIVYILGFACTIRWTDFVDGTVDISTFASPVWEALCWKYFLYAKIACKVLSFLHII